MTRYSYTLDDVTVTVSHAQLELLEELLEDSELCWWTSLDKPQKALVRALEKKGLVKREYMIMDSDIVTLTELGQALADDGPDETISGGIHVVSDEEAAAIAEQIYRSSRE